MAWTTACPDWAERVRTRQSIIPPPIYPDQAEYALSIFKQLKVVNRIYTDTECDAWRDADLAIADRAVHRLITVPLSDWQRAALIDFTYNLGAGNLADSNMRRKFNAGDYAGGCAELDRWVKGRVGGVLVTLPGLVTRREVGTWVCLQR